MPSQACRARCSGHIWQLAEQDGEAHYGPSLGLEKGSELRVTIDFSLTVAFRIAQRFVGPSHAHELSAQLFGKLDQTSQRRDRLDQLRLTGPFRA